MPITYILTGLLNRATKFIKKSLTQTHMTTTPTISTLTIWGYKLLIVTLLGSTLYFALAWQTLKYAAEKDQAIAELKLQQLNEELTKLPK